MGHVRRVGATHRGRVPAYSEPRSGLAIVTLLAPTDMFRGPAGHPSTDRPHRTPRVRGFCACEWPARHVRELELTGVAIIGPSAGLCVLRSDRPKQPRANRLRCRRTEARDCPFPWLSDYRWPLPASFLPSNAWRILPDPPTNASRRAAATPSLAAGDGVRLRPARAGRGAARRSTPAPGSKTQLDFCPFSTVTRAVPRLKARPPETGVRVLRRPRRTHGLRKPNPPTANALPP